MRAAHSLRRLPSRRAAASQAIPALYAISLSWFNSSTKPSGDVILGLGIVWVGENLIGGTELDNLPFVEKGRVVRDAGSLLHIVGDDDDGVMLFQGVNQLFNACRGDRINR